MSDFSLPTHHSLAQKKILCLDYGSKVVGVAVYHVGRDPYPLIFGSIVHKTLEQLNRDILKIMDDECVDTLVVGVPYFTDGKASSQTQRTLDFIQQLKLQITIPVFEQDETLSTFEAQERMKQSARYNFQVDESRIDEVSASIILEDFISRCRQGFIL